MRRAPTPKNLGMMTTNWTWAAPWRGFRLAVGGECLRSRSQAGAVALVEAEAEALPGTCSLCFRGPFNCAERSYFEYPCMYVGEV
jgi:hypothetical protein